MSFQTLRDVNLRLNNRNILCNSIALTQSAEIANPVAESEMVSITNSPTSPINNQLAISYYITGKDYLRDFLFTTHTQPISGNLCGLIFTKGYLESYSLDASPNSPLNISATIKICDEISGNFAATSPNSLPIVKPVWHFDDAIFSGYSYSITTLNNIISYSWDYKAEITPIYYQNQTGLRAINPDAVSFGPKQISCDIISDSENLPLSYSGESIALDLVCQDPTLSISQSYPISGKISRKGFSVRAGDTSQTVFSITQSHINHYPKIESVSTSPYPLKNYIIILSPDNNPTNGFFSPDNNFPLVERVMLGDRDLNFVVSKSGTRDVITGYLPPDIINGYLQVYTTKGLLNYTSGLTLTYSGIGVSGFTPDTGNPYGQITITGTNFYRVDKVLFNNVPALFNVYDTTGSFHKILATIPNNILIGKIAVCSSLRNKSGISTGYFYPNPVITGTTATGTWSGLFRIEGFNFSGITNVYFNGIRSKSFAVSNNQLITGRIPGTGEGYTKGYVSISGYRGMSAISNTIYQPILKITGIYALPGLPYDDMIISGIFDPNFLYPSGLGNNKTGYGVAFNQEIAFFSGDMFRLSGRSPQNLFGSSYPAMVEPDGVTRYSKFTGQYASVARPYLYTINDLYTFTYKKFKFYDISLKGENLTNFFGMPNYLYISGYQNHNLGETYSFNDISENFDGTQAIARNVRVTGYGAYKVFPVNFAGTGQTLAAFWNDNTSSSIEYLEAGATATASSRCPTANLTTWSQLGYPQNAIDFNGIESYFCSFPFGGTNPADTTASSGYLDIRLASSREISAIRFYGHEYKGVTNASTSSLQFFREGTFQENDKITFSALFSRANTGMLQVDDSEGNILLSSGVSFDDGIVLLPKISNARNVRFYRNETNRIFLLFVGINVF